MQRKRKVSIKYWIVFFSLLFLAAGFMLVSGSGPNAEDPAPQSCIRMPPHAHADFMVVLNGRRLNFSKPEYNDAHPLIHIHVSNYGGGEVLHIESRETTLDDFFESLGTTFSADCFIAGKEYCGNATHTVKFYVNGERNSRFERYMPKDLDRILIIYGNETEDEIRNWTDSVTSLACIFSMKCEPPQETEGALLDN